MRGIARLACLRWADARRTKVLRRTGLLHRLIYGPDAELRSYEAAVLQAALEGLPAGASEKMRQQIGALPSRQRHSDDRVVAFFPDCPGELPSALFANRQDDLLMAEMDLLTSQGVPLHAKLFAANGCFYSIEFDETPRAAGVRDGGLVSIENARFNPNIDP